MSCVNSYHSKYSALTWQVTKKSTVISFSERGSFSHQQQNKEKSKKPPPLRNNELLSLIYLHSTLYANDERNRSWNLFLQFSLSTYARLERNIITNHRITYKISYFLVIVKLWYEEKEFFDFVKRPRCYWFESSEAWICPRRCRRSIRLGRSR